MSHQPKGKNDEVPGAAEIDEVCQEDAEIAALLEKARQNVKHLVKEELEGERITQELLDFRMRAVDGS